jgi:hypothetical protein
LIVAVFTSEPLVPVIVMAVVAAAAVGLTVSVKLLVWLPEMELGEKAAATPVGRPEAVTATAPEKPVAFVKETVAGLRAP